MSWNDTQQSDGEAAVMVELQGIWSIHLLPLFPSPLGILAPDRVLSMGQIEQNGVLMQYWIVLNSKGFVIETVISLNWIVWNITILRFNCVSKNYTCTKLYCLI